MVKMGPSPNNLKFQAKVTSGYAIFIPARTYHNLINIGNVPIKLYSIYAPPEHPRGTLHELRKLRIRQKSIIIKRDKGIKS